MPRIALLYPASPASNKDTSHDNAEAQAKMDMYTNNEVAKLQMANDYDGIIAMAAELEDAALAQCKS